MPSPNVLLAIRVFAEQVQNSKTANSKALDFREAVRSKTMFSKVPNMCVTDGQSPK